MGIAVTKLDIAVMRLHSLGLGIDGASSPDEPVEVVRHHLAMQAQDWAASRWAVGSRLSDATDADVLGAYDAGEIVRSWPMRGTVHVVAAEDLHWMLELMGQRALAGVERRWKVLGIEGAMLERARDVAVDMLHGGRRCSRSEFREALVEAGLDLAGPRAYHTVWYLCQTGTLVQGPTRDGEHLLVLLDEWVLNPRQLTRDDAIAELGRRYLAARGPATVEDLEHWTKLTKRDCRAAFAANADALVEIERGGAMLSMLREHYEWYEQLDRPARAPRSTLALAAFDEHLLGYRDRSDVLDARHATYVDPGRNGVFRWTIVLDGQVVGTWSRTRRARHIRVDITPFASISRPRREAVIDAIGRWGSFVGMPVEVEFGARAAPA